MIFFTPATLLIVVGRLLGELMQRIGQPAVIGQLLAGIILRPSEFGALWPSAQNMIFPTVSAERQMLNAVSELGVLLHFFHSRRFFHGFGESVCRERATLLCSAPS
jgi:Kef-type K+ transport system membrane component KefB